jgi:hypothetical protein
MENVSYFVQWRRENSKILGLKFGFLLPLQIQFPITAKHFKKDSIFNELLKLRNTQILFY